MQTLQLEWKCKLVLFRRASNFPEQDDSQTRHVEILFFCKFITNAADTCPPKCRRWFGVMITCQEKKKCCSSAMCPTKITGTWWEEKRPHLASGVRRGLHPWPGTYRLTKSLRTRLNFNLPPLGFYLSSPFSNLMYSSSCTINRLNRWIYDFLINIQEIVHSSNKKYDITDAPNLPLEVCTI